MDYLPLYLLWPIVFVLGTVIGSFANVVIDRARTGKSLNDRSHCFSCGKTLKWYELFPLFSYLFLRGRCRSCQALISGRFFLVELGLGLVFVLIIANFGFTLTTLFSWFLAFWLLVILVYDLRHLIVPDEWSLAVAIGGFLVALSSVGFAWSALLSAVGTGFAAFAFFGGMWLISGGRWIGLGDAKLSFGLGFVLGWMELFSFIVWSFWSGAIISLTLMGVQLILKKGTTYLGFTGPGLKMKSEVPFAPFLILGFALVYLFELDVLGLIAYVFATIS